MKRPLIHCRELVLHKKLLDEVIAALEPICPQSEGDFIAFNSAINLLAIVASDIGRLIGEEEDKT